MSGFAMIKRLSGWYESATSQMIGRENGSALTVQLFRYVLVGGFVTALQALTYWLLAHFAGVHPQMANAAGYLVAVASGYVLHGRITFRGRGAQRDAGQAVRFVLVSLLSLALNALWVQLTTGWMGWPLWSPVPLMAVVTPGLVFTLNRWWVFRHPQTS
jgi:putative flippase GtrA